MCTDSDHINFATQGTVTTTNSDGEVQQYADTCMIRGKLCYPGMDCSQVSFAIVTPPSGLCNNVDPDCGLNDPVLSPILQECSCNVLENTCGSDLQSLIGSGGEVTCGTEPDQWGGCMDPATIDPNQSYSSVHACSYGCASAACSP
jgi:hypothetical protein